MNFSLTTAIESLSEPDPDRASYTNCSGAPLKKKGIFDDINIFVKFLPKYVIREVNISKDNYCYSFESSLRLAVKCVS